MPDDQTASYPPPSEAGQSMRVPIQRLPSGAGLPLPSYETAGAAGMDLRAAVTEPVIIPPGGRCLVPTGFAVAVPAGHEMQIRGRSGLAARAGIRAHPGTIDSDYRGEVGIVLFNLGREPFLVSRGDRIAQAVIAPVVRAGLVEVESLDETARGAAGFGSTGSA